MEAQQPATHQAYRLIRERITSLQLAPGAPVNEKRLAAELEMDLAPVQEALKLLAHDNLVVISPPQEHGTYVAHIHLADLDQRSQVRLTLESLSARLAAEMATAEDLAALQALRQ